MRIQNGVAIRHKHQSKPTQANEMMMTMNMQLRATGKHSALKEQIMSNHGQCNSRDLLHQQMGKQQCMETLVRRKGRRRRRRASGEKVKVTTLRKSITSSLHRMNNVLSISFAWRFLQSFKCPPFCSSWQFCKQYRYACAMYIKLACQNLSCNASTSQAYREKPSSVNHSVRCT